VEFVTHEDFRAVRRGAAGDRADAPELRLASSVLLLVAVAGENGKPRIFGKLRIAGREFAEKKRRAAVGFDRAGVDTIGTKACVRNSVGHGRILAHGKSIAAARGKSAGIARQQQISDWPRIPDATPGGSGLP
jgi:hypothetical protein